MKFRPNKMKSLVHHQFTDGFLNVFLTRGGVRSSLAVRLSSRRSPGLLIFIPFREKQLQIIDQSFAPFWGTGKG